MKQVNETENSSMFHFLCLFFFLFTLHSCKPMAKRSEIKTKTGYQSRFDRVYLVVFRSAMPKNIHSGLLWVRYLSQKDLLLFLRTQRREGNARNLKIQIPHLIPEGRRWWWHGRNHRLTFASIFRIKISFKKKKKEMCYLSG